MPRLRRVLNDRYDRFQSHSSGDDFANDDDAAVDVDLSGPIDSQDQERLIKQLKKNSLLNNKKMMKVLQGLIVVANFVLNAVTSFRKGANVLLSAISVVSFSLSFVILQLSLNQINHGNRLIHYYLIKLLDATRMTKDIFKLNYINILISSISPLYIIFIAKSYGEFMNIIYYLPISLSFLIYMILNDHNSLNDQIDKLSSLKYHYKSV